jgi:hypothetical protein
LLDDAATVRAQTADSGPLSRDLMALAAVLKARDRLVKELDNTLAAQQASLLPQVHALVDAGTPLTVGLPGGGAGTASEPLAACLAAALAAVAAAAAAVDASVALQPAAMASVLRANEAFDAARLKDAVTLGRQKVVRSLASTATDSEGWFSTTDEFNNAWKWYTDREKHR